MSAGPAYEVIEREDDFVVLQVRGELSGRVWTDQLKRSLEEHYVDDGVKRIRVDISPVSFVDNYGVATLVALQGHSRERGKQFFLEGAQGQPREKLEVTGVLRILEQGG
jgi:anti-anti-sigma factor